MRYRAVICISALSILLLQSPGFAVNIRDVVYTPKSTGKVVFSHESHRHRKDMDKNCRACHDAIFDLKKKKHFTMTDMEKGKSCGACHNGKKAFGIDTCVRCHPVREITYQVKETGPTQFSHKAHLAVAQCKACHPKPYSANQKNRHVGMTAMEKGRSCGTCHNGRQAFSVKDCTKCHPVRERVFEEKSTGNVVFSHTFHSGLNSCADCHPTLYRTVRSTVKISMTDMEQGKSCGACHDGKTAFSVTEKCDTCHKI